MPSEDGLLPETLPLSAGLVKTRMMFGLPMNIALLSGLVGILPIVAFRTYWLLVLPVLVWAAAKYHARKDPDFLQSWVSQMAFKTFYH